MAWTLKFPHRRCCSFLTAGSLFLLGGGLSVAPAWGGEQVEQGLTVSIAAPAYWCPYACDVSDASASRQGFTVEIARAAFESVGHRIQYRNLPYERALFEARRGNIDGTMPTFKGEAPAFLYPAHAVSMSEYCFYVPEDETWRYSGPDSLVDIRFVATSGYTYGEQMDAYIAANLDTSVSLLQGEDIPERLQKMVRNGHHDALLDERLLFEASQMSDGLVNAGCLAERHPGYLALSPKHPERSRAIAVAFDLGFEQIRADGRLCGILEKYELSASFLPGVRPDNCPAAVPGS